MRRAAPALLLVTLASPVFAEDRQAFDGWLASCRGDGYCSAVAKPKAEPLSYAVKFGRHAKEIFWEVSLSTPVPVDLSAAPLIVSVDGRKQPFQRPSEIGRYGSGTDFHLLGSGAQAVMDRLPHGRTLTLSFSGKGSASHEVAVPLKGLTAALMWIDTQQNRIGSERVAEAPPVGLEPLDSANALLANVPPAVMAMRDADTDCRPIAEISNGEDIAIDTLDESATLYILPCWDAAYNFGWKGWVQWSDEVFNAVALPEFSPTGGWTAGTNLINYSYDPATRQLGTYYKGRGTGDCGYAGLYQWGRHQFRLLEFRAREDCDASPSVDESGGFPVVYLADNASLAQRPGGTGGEPAPAN